MAQRSSVCCFCGHRPDKLTGWQGNPSAALPLRHAFEQAVDEAVRDGYTVFLSGMALGVDTWAAEAILRRRKAGLPLKLVAALPCLDQDARWPASDRQHYRELLAQVDARYLACKGYTPYCMHARNRWMVEHSSRLIAVFDGSAGGTAHTVGLAQEQGLAIVRLRPQDYI